MNKFYVNAFRSTFLLVLLLCGTNVFGQEQASEPEIAPPPIIALSENEKTKIAQAPVKKRLEIILDFAEMRLKAAETLTEKNDFAAASAELGAFRALNREAVKFIATQGKSGKARDQARTFEMSLRRQIPRIETLRRSTPFNYSGHIASLLDYVRDLRSKALESFFDDSVIEEN